MRSFSLALVSVAALLGVSGCVSVASTGERLSEARALLVAARAKPGATRAAPALEEAEAAVEYAEFEERLRPGNPLTPERASRALDKARSAFMACDPSGR